MIPSREPAVEITPERAVDSEAIRAVLLAAFADEFEADLVEAARDSPVFDPELALVARVRGTVVGYVLFLPVRIGESEVPQTLVLAPIAVHPDRQREGIGGSLLRAGLARGRTRGYRAVVLHGDPGFYGQFGFQEAAQWGVENPLETPSDEFLGRELVPGGFERIAGGLRYPAVLAERLD